MGLAARGWGSGRAFGRPPARREDVPRWQDRGVRIGRLRTRALVGAGKLSDRCAHGTRDGESRCRGSSLWSRERWSGERCQRLAPFGRQKRFKTVSGGGSHMKNEDGKMVDKMSAHDVDDLDLSMPRILADLADGALGDDEANAVADWLMATADE